MYGNDNDFAGPRLPRVLLEQVDGGVRSSARRKPSRGKDRFLVSRKDKRKAEREQKKSRSQDQELKEWKWKGGAGDGSVRDDGHVDNPIRRPSPLTRKDETAFRGAIALNPIARDSQGQKIPDPQQAQVAKPSGPAHVSRKTEERLEADDVEIAALEKKLGLKSKKLPKSFQEDGLGDLLDGLDDVEAEPERRGKRKSKEDQAWLKRKRQKTTLKGVSDQLDAGERGSEDESHSSRIDGIDSGASDSDSNYGSLEVSLKTTRGSNTKLAPAPGRIKENPYIAPLTAISSEPTKYIPPSRRVAPLDDKELDQRLRRQTQGLLNRLSDSNLISIVKDVEKLFQVNPRRHVTTTLVDLLLTLICDRTTLNDTFIILHAGFIAAIYKIIGPDFGAQIVEGIVLKVDKSYSDLSVDVSAGKATANLISLLAQLFNFQVVSSDILFDYTRLFLSSLTEAHTELLLRIVRTSGPQLRQHDPASIKDIVQLLQKTVAAATEGHVSVRTKFMIETINDLKNNRLKTGVANTAVAADHLSRMRKTLGSLSGSHTIKASEPLRISLSDVRNGDQNGKWWLVGASWKGSDSQTLPPDPLKQTQNTDVEVAAESDSDLDDFMQNTMQDLPTLAQHNGMNNPLRRSIFAALVTATDYRDAHTRLLKLRLSRAQEREIPRVLLHCSATESRYNPYYSLVARRLCADRKTRATFQFALWDFLKRIGGIAYSDNFESDDNSTGDIGVQTIVNHAKLYGSLIAARSLSITVLKTLDVAVLGLRSKSTRVGNAIEEEAKSKMTTFLEVLLITLLVQASRSNGRSLDVDKSERGKAQKLYLQAIFEPVLDLPSLAEGLRTFVTRRVRKSDLVSDAKERRKVRSGCDIVSVLLLSTGDGPRKTVVLENDHASDRGQAGVNERQ